MDRLFSEVQLDDSRSGFFDDWSRHAAAVLEIHHTLQQEYKESASWMTDLQRQNTQLVNTVHHLANEIKQRAQVLVVIGVGGSYMGAKAIQQALTSSNDVHQDGIEVIYVGHNLSGAYMREVLARIEHKELYVHVISKSGTTLETTLAFRVFRQYMKTRYGSRYHERILVTTDERPNALKIMAEQKKYRLITIPSSVGGRFSVFTAVGLLPLAVAGVNIDALLKGVHVAASDLDEGDVTRNQAYQYAVLRNELYNNGFQIELLATFEPALASLQEWWKQLFAESEGKEGKGIFPSCACYSTDLHSLGQYVQEGRPLLFETILHFKQNDKDYIIPLSEEEDGLHDLSVTSFNEMNAITKDGVIAAHAEASVPIIQFQIEKLDAYHIGYLCFFFMKACVMSASLLQVNPFNQPGVERYKLRTAELLKKNTLHKIY